MLGKSKWSAAWFHNILKALKLVYNRNKLFKTLHYWSRNMLNFEFLDRVFVMVSPVHLVYDFSRKMFLMLYSINWPNFIVWLPLLLEILGNISNQAVFIHAQKFKTKTEISWEWNELLRWNKIIFKGLSVVKNCPRL